MRVIKNKVDDARGLLLMRLRQALDHSHDGRIGVTHHHLNVRAFEDALIRYIDIKIDDAITGALQQYAHDAGSAATYKRAAKNKTKGTDSV